MALDTRYIPTKYFHEIFLDKDTGCPLSGGKVKFFRDVSRTTPKDVFILSGSPPNYTYVNIGSEVNLTSYGTFEYNNNDVTVYLFPYDSSGVVDLYYATVESAGSVQQITREGFPNLIEGEGADEDIINYVPNGQFLLHNDIVADEGATPAIEAGEITDDITKIAQGGWTFERTSGSAAKDFVLFERISSYVEVPSKSPRYSINVKNESPGVTDLFKELRLTFKDVNKFASDTQKYTFAFQAKTNSGSSSIEVKLRKFYGTGGSAPEETTLQIINLTSDYQYYDIPLIFGDNIGKTIGTNNDDYVQLNIAFPISSAFDHNLANFVLLKGDEQVTEFPDTTDEQMVRDSDAGLLPVPDYSGKNLYLPIMQGLNGFEYDTSHIGKVFPASTEGLQIGELWPDGAKYRVAAYSDDKIPYRRIYDAYSKNSPYGLPIYGTGQDEMRYVALEATDQSFSTSDSDTNINNDAYQSFTAGVTGELVNIGITMGTPAPSPNSTISIYEGEGIGGKLLARETGINLITGLNSIDIGDQPNIVTGSKYSIRIENSGSVFWRTNSTGGYAGGSYNGTAADAVFSTDVRVSDVVDYRLYSNTGGAVVAAGDGIIATGFTFTPVQPDPYIVEITAIAASGMTAGSWWFYNTTDSRKYIVWYEIDGSGTKPTDTADVYLKVSVLSTDTAATVNNKTSLVINGYSVATPSYGGYFFRITNNAIGIDPDTHLRTDRGDGHVGDAVGTIQECENLSHAHGLGGSFQVVANGANFGVLEQTGAEDSLASGGNEARPKNIYINAVIKY